ncbi:hypothetical protein DLJ46_13780 [Micromonospora globispora]|uniref:LacI family transcriptional regulator n=1 Tax=Micromonospora globispora TaxID=1450148 RepID=A0A317K406_9ACTN|nr:hypothetical protein [Micromonospora globispora]PWU47686.1 hypothetical protein DLJ46_13780 [Micromonospora globispora]RQW82834.1 hypothetical protein DKL51_32505 [Micromonospora globispora]
MVPALQPRHRTDTVHVSFDDFPVAESRNPPVIAASQHPQRLGRQGGEPAPRRDQRETDPLRRVVLPVRLVVRRSSKLPPPV